MSEHKVEGDGNCQVNQSYLAMNISINFSYKGSECTFLLSLVSSFVRPTIR